WVTACIAAVPPLGGTAAKPATPELERGAYVLFDLSPTIADAPDPIDFGALGGRAGTLQLRTVTRALRAAAKDDRVAGVYLSGDLTPSAFGSGYAALKEVRAALAEVKAANKPVIA